MACKRSIFVLICYLITNVFPFELEFESCGNNGWTCVNDTNGNVNVTFSCPQEFEKIHQTILWKFKGLPPLTQSVIIKDCNTALSVTINTLDVATNKYPHLCSFIIKDVNELITNKSTFSIPEILKGASSIKFENILKIINFNENTIAGSTVDSGQMKSFTFEMKNVQIQNMKERSVWWTEGEIPYAMSWENVTVNVVEGDAVHISDTKKKPKTKVFIHNCKFGDLQRHSFNVRSTDFEFTDNEVESVEKSAFRVQSDKTIFLNNDFSHINNYAFLFVNIGSGEKSLTFESNTINQADKLSMNFGAPYYNELNGKVSFHNNKFNCINSTWLQRSDDEKIENKGGEEEEVQYYKYLKKIEKQFLDDNQNVCINLPCSISVSKFKDLYKKNGQTKSFCT